MVSFVGIIVYFQEF